MSVGFRVGVAASNRGESVNCSFRKAVSDSVIIGWICDTEWEIQCQGLDLLADLMFVHAKNPEGACRLFIELYEKTNGVPLVTPGDRIRLSLRRSGDVHWVNYELSAEQVIHYSIKECPL